MVCRGLDTGAIRVPKERDAELAVAAAAATITARSLFDPGLTGLSPSRH